MTTILTPITSIKQLRRILLLRRNILKRELDKWNYNSCDKLCIEHIGQLSLVNELLKRMK